MADTDEQTPTDPIPTDPEEEQIERAEGEGMPAPEAEPMASIEPEAEADAEAPLPSGRGGSIFALGWRLLILAGLLASAAAAWRAQATYHLEIGKYGDKYWPGPSAYCLLGPAGSRMVEQRANKKPPPWTTLYFDEKLFWEYAAAAGAFALFSLFVARPYKSGVAFQPMLTDTLTHPLRRRRVRFLPRAGMILGALALLAAFAFCALFTAASARANNFAYPPNLNKADKFLYDFYQKLGYTLRPNAWYPVFTFFAALLSAWGAAALLMLAGGLGWAYYPCSAAGPSRRKMWEWGALAAILITLTAGYLWKAESIPWSFHQSEGLVGLGAVQLNHPEQNISPFDNGIQPSTSFLTRSIGVAVGGRRLDSIRYVSALTSGVGLLCMFLLVRSFLGGPAALLATLLTGLSHTVIHYSRVGINNIDGMYWIVLITYAFYQAESSRPGAGQLSKYFFTGMLSGGSWGLFTGAPLGAVMVAAFMFIRLALQARYRVYRLWSLGLVLFGLALGIMPYVLNPASILRRQNDISILYGRQIGNEFNHPDVQALKIDTVPKLLLYRLRVSMQGYFACMDSVMEFSSPHPFAGPLLGALAICGAFVLMLRFRSWLAIFVASFYVGGCFLGGAVLMGPYPPSSARLLMMLPALTICAALSIETIVNAFKSVIDSCRAFRHAFFRRMAQAFLVLGCMLAGWSAAAEGWNNIQIYKRWLDDPNVLFNLFMSHTSEIYRTLIDHPTANGQYAVEPDIIYQYEADGAASQFYVYNEFFHPFAVKHTMWMTPENPLRLEQVPENSWVLFIFHRDWNNKGAAAEFERVKQMLPGGRTFRSQAMNFPGMEPRYTFYQVRTFRHLTGPNAAPPPSPPIPPPVEAMPPPAPPASPAPEMPPPTPEPSPSPTVVPPAMPDMPTTPTLQQAPPSQDMPTTPSMQPVPPSA